MKNNSLLNKILTISGLTLVWLPILIPLVFLVVHLISTGSFLFDFLMPAELGLMVFIGAGLLMWASISNHTRIKWIAWGYGIAVVLLLGGQGLAVLTGLASGDIAASGWKYNLVLGMMIGYDLAVVALGLGGIMLAIDLFRKKTP